MNLVKELSLQNPFLLLAPAPQTIDPVTEWAVLFAVEHFDNPRRKSAVRFRPRDAFIKVYQMTLIDACGCGVDDHEHLSGKVVAPAIEDDARHMDAFGVVGM